MFKKIVLVAVFGTLPAGAALAADYTLIGPTYSAAVGVTQTAAGLSVLDLSGLFDTNFVLVNSNGTQTYQSNATINLTGPDGISFSQAISDAGNVPVGSGYVQTTHSTAFDFLIALTPAQQAAFVGTGSTDVTVSLTNYSTTGPTSSTAFYSWDVKNGSVAAPVPEADSYGLLLCGFGLVGVITRRMKKAA